MKIGHNPEVPGALAPGAAAKPQAKAAPAPEVGGSAGKSAAAAASGVPVTLSNAARTQGPAGRLQGDFDAGKVKAVRTAIENGTFKVDAEAVADKMLANSQEFLARGRV